MIKKAIIAAGISSLLAMGVIAGFGINNSDFGKSSSTIRANAEQEERSVTFDLNSLHGAVGYGTLFLAETKNGNTVGMHAIKNKNEALNKISFNGSSFNHISFHNAEYSLPGGFYVVTNITAVRVVYAGGILFASSIEESEYDPDLESGIPTPVPNDIDGLDIWQYGNEDTTITSITVYYTC